MRPGGVAGEPGGHRYVTLRDPDVGVPEHLLNHRQGDPFLDGEHRRAVPGGVGAGVMPGTHISPVDGVLPVAICAKHLGGSRPPTATRRVILGRAGANESSSAAAPSTSAPSLPFGAAAERQHRVDRAAGCAHSQESQSPDRRGDRSGPHHRHSSTRTRPIQRAGHAPAWTQAHAGQRCQPAARLPSRASNGDGIRAGTRRLIKLMLVSYLPVVLICILVLGLAVLLVLR